MNRRKFLYLGLGGLCFFGCSSLGFVTEKERTCQDCPNDYFCCTAYPTVPLQGKEFEIVQKCADLLNIKVRFNREGLVTLGGCPLFNKDHLCDMYKYRPMVCRLFLCPWLIEGWSRDKKRRYEEYHLQRWQYGKNVNLADIALSD